MKVYSVKYERLKNLGSYQHEKVGVEVILDDGEAPGLALKRAKAFVSAALESTYDAHDIERARHIIDNPDDYRGREVNEARALLAEAMDDEIPF